MTDSAVYERAPLCEGYQTVMQAYCAEKLAVRLPSLLHPTPPLLPPPLLPRPGLPPLAPPLRPTALQLLIRTTTVALLPAPLPQRKTPLSRLQS